VHHHSPLRHPSPRDVASLRHEGALVLAARYHWDPLASGLSAVLLRLGGRGTLLLDGLLFDDHGALHCSAARIAANGLLISFLRFSLARVCVLLSVRLAGVRLTKRDLRVAPFLVPELARPLIRGSLLRQLRPARPVGLEASLPDEYGLLGDDVVSLLSEVLRTRMVLLSLR